MLFLKGELFGDLYQHRVGDVGLVGDHLEQRFVVDGALIQDHRDDSRLQRR
jgi:hypothetical protein